MAKLTRREFLKTTAGAAAAGSLGVGGTLLSQDALAQGHWKPEKGAKLRRANGRAEVELAGGARVPAPRDAAGEDGQPVVFGTRPEHLVLAASGQGLPAEVVVVEPTGADTQVFAKIGGTEVTAVFRERYEFRAGEAIRLAPDHERTHLFDAASGKSLRALG